jgi:hypothetical protein
LSIIAGVLERLEDTMTELSSHEPGKRTLTHKRGAGAMLAGNLSAHIQWYLILQFVDVVGHVEVTVLLPRKGDIRARKRFSVRAGLDSAQLASSLRQHLPRHGLLSLLCPPIAVLVDVQSRETVYVLSEDGQTLELVSAETGSWSVLRWFGSSPKHHPLRKKLL